jgi:hypothetical protein
MEPTTVQITVNATITSMLSIHWSRRNRPDRPKQ